MTAADDDQAVGPPSFAQLLDWVEGRLTRHDAGLIEQRVEVGDVATRQSLDWIETFRSVALANPLPEPPPAVRQRLLQSFDRRHGRSPDIERLAAELSFDSRDDAALVGVRGGAEVDESYRLAFTAGRFGILLDVLPEPGGTFLLDGQVLAPEADAEAQVWEVTVEYPGGIARNIEGTDLGTFSIAGVPADATGLRLSTGLIELVVEGPLGSGR